MAQDINEVVKFIQSQFVELLGDLSDYELSIIEKSIKFPFIKTFTSSSAMTDTIQSMIGNLSDLAYLENKIKALKYELYIKYRSEYEKQFTILTRAGRPSKLAIDSEIHYSSPKLSEMRNKIELYENLLSYLENQIELVRMSIRNYENQKFHS